MHPLFASLGIIVATISKSYINKLDMILRKNFFYFALLLLATVFVMPACESNTDDDKQLNELNAIE